jgi:uncharacterized lipoprotein NlpE involved in copper resistance
MMQENEFNRRRDDEIQRTLGKIEATLENMDKKLDDTTTYVREVSGRVKVLELWRSGIAAVITFIVAVAGYFEFTGGK